MSYFDVSLVWYEHEFSKAWSLHPRVTCPFVISRKDKSKLKIKFQFKFDFELFKRYMT